jgi:hypothetical protein
MIAYRYNKVTKELLGEQQAFQDPLNGGYLLPQYCTFTEPGAKETGYTQVYDKGQDIWVKTEDHRGEWQVKLDDLTFSLVDYIGGIKEGYQLVTQEEVANYLEDSDRYKVIDGVFTDISDTEEYKEIKREKEAERVGNLTCTKRVFVLMLEQLGFDYFAQIEPLIESNRQAKLEWALCVELERKNPLLDTVGASIGVTPEQLDNLFKYANNEIQKDDFLGV